MSKRLHNRGGKRPGAGRPTKADRGQVKRRAVTLTLEPATVAALDAWAGSEGIARSEAADRLLSDALGLASEVSETQALLNELDGLLPGLQGAPEIHG